MKPSLVALSFLLFAFPLAFSQIFQPVLDVDGEPVLTGGEYFSSSPPVPGQRFNGILRLRITGNSKLPATVEVNYGFLVDFSVNFIKGANGSVVFTNTPLEIEFLEIWTIDVEPRWVVVVDSDLHQTYVGIGGPEDHPGQQVYSGTFKILESVNNRYGLAFCLPIIVDGSPVCWNIGLHSIRKDLSLLVLTNGEPSFQFNLTKGTATPGIRTVI